MKAWPWLSMGLACAGASVACVLIPMYVIRPFHPQDPETLDVALPNHEAGPLLAGLCAAFVVALTVWSWKRVLRRAPRIWFQMAMVSLSAVAIAGACLTHVNIFEKMFHPYDAPGFESANKAQVDPNDMVLAVVLGGHARAYPILTIALSEPATNQQSPHAEGGPRSIAELIAHYRLKESAGESNGRKAFCTRAAYECYWNRWVLPRRGISGSIRSSQSQVKNGWTALSGRGGRERRSETS